MGKKLVTGPSQEPVTLAEAKLHLRVDTADEDEYLDTLITVARQAIEDYLGRALLEQTWDLVLDGELPDLVTLKPAPLISVTGVYATDLDGTETTLGVTEYAVDTTTSGPGRLFKTTSYISRVIRDYASYRIRFKTGYYHLEDEAPVSDPADVPEAIRQGLLELISCYYEDRLGETAPLIPGGIRQVLAAYRVYRI